MAPLDIPKSLREEHEELHQFLARVTREKGAIGEAARLVARVLEPHFRREETFAAPPLSLLAPLARGKLDADMAEAITHADWLKDNLADMLAEHRMVAAALEAMLQAAGEQDRPELVSFAEKLLNHARMEEEIFYPAAILVGEYLKLRLGKAALHATS